MASTFRQYIHPISDCIKGDTARLNNAVLQGMNLTTVLYKEQRFCHHYRCSHSTYRQPAMETGLLIGQWLAHSAYRPQVETNRMDFSDNGCHILPTDVRDGQPVWSASRRCRPLSGATSSSLHLWSVDRMCQQDNQYFWTLDKVLRTTS
jgi:hypothetical protein